MICRAFVARLLFRPCDGGLCCKPVVQLVPGLEPALLGNEICRQSNARLRIGCAILSFGRDELPDVLVALQMSHSAVADDRPLTAGWPRRFWLDGHIVA